MTQISNADHEIYSSKDNVMLKYQKLQTVNRLTVPVLLLLYNRPDYTRKSIACLSSVAPSSLYIACDGPKNGNSKDMKLCNEVKTVVQNIPWKCTVRRLYRHSHSGSKFGLSESIKWFFSHVSKGIILEDDCMPNVSFFWFCKELLEKYKNNKKIMHISGTNFQRKRIYGNASYYFSRFPQVWGWASWRRAWRQYDIDMRDYTDSKNYTIVKKIFHNHGIERYFEKIFESVRAGKVEAWDYQWFYHIWKNNGICITPQTNMITNIGFDHRATHTTYTTSVSYVPTKEINVIVHPKRLSVCRDADERLFLNIYKPTPIMIMKDILFRRIPKFE